MTAAMMKMSYGRLALVLVASFLLMFLLSQSMIAAWSHFEVFNVSNFYMALSMTAAMAIVMILGMWGMFANTATTVAVLVSALVLLGVSLWCVRSSAFIGDDAFMRSMIPHHSRAIQMCERSQLKAPDVISLCGEIIRSQQKEIDQMQSMLAR